jgi:LysR family glycine cleavage system transcriptional activator
MATPSHLRSLQAVELTIRKGSLKAAANQLAITPAALGQRIKALEDYLGFDLLVRGRSGIRPTRELEAALAHLSAAFRELETVAQILDFQRVHEIHIVADTDWAELWLKPRLPKFKQMHPNTLFCINGVGDVPVRLGQFDCEIWFGDIRGEGQVEELFADYLLPISSPENTERISALPEAERLEGFPLLHLDCYTRVSNAFGWPEWVKRHGYRQTGAGRGMRYDRVVNALEAIYSDAGLIICGLALVQPLLEKGTLSLPFPTSQGTWSEQSYCIAFTAAAMRRGQTQDFRDWLLREAESTRNELADFVTNSA